MDFANAATLWETRSLCLIKVGDGTLLGLGEASPLPGVSYESLEDVQNALKHVPKHFVLPSRLKEVFSLAKFHSKEIPSLRFALETAYIDFLSQKKKQSIPQLLGTSSKQSVQGSSLFDPSFTTEQNAANFKKNDVTCAKFKAPKDFASQFIAKLETFHRLAPSVSIRLDANQSWTQTVAQSYCDALKDLPIEFIEEPCQNWDQAFGLDTAIPFACDESLYPHKETSRCADDFLRSPKITVAVLKPMVLGGIEVTQRLIKRLKDHNVHPILSHCLGGGVEFAMLKEFASTFESSISHGIGRHKGINGFELLVDSKFDTNLSSSAIGLNLPPSLL